jgi:DNA-binding transcriptional ArsR family regulator
MERAVTIDCTEFCRALADDTRQRILVLLADREMCVTEIVGAFKMTQPTISHHLNVLRQNGLLNRRKDGKLVYYSLNHGNVVSCCGRLMAKFDAATDCRTS